VFLPVRLSPIYGQSTDSGNLGPRFGNAAIPVALAVVLLLTT